MNEQATFVQYDPFQRAYLIDIAENVTECPVRMKSSFGILNPVFVFNRLSSIQSIKIGKKELSPERIKTGTSQKGETVVFIDAELGKRQTVTFLFGK